VKLDDVKLGVSPLTDTMYMGTVSKKDPCLWLQKREATSDFCGALLSWIPPGSTRTIRSSNGAWYEIEVRQTKPETATVGSSEALRTNEHQPGVVKDSLTVEKENTDV
jgi:hypothetical protein